MTNIFQEGKNAADADTLSINKADAAIREVMQRFKQLTASLAQSVEVMERESGRVQSEISDALVALQFQDRVSQIQSHVTQSLNALLTLIENSPDSALNTESWVQEMAREFSTQEEFDNLRSKGAKLVSRQSADGVTYF